MKAHLERIDQAAGIFRFYIVMIQQTLLGEWAVVREWGRIGQGRTVRVEAYSTKDVALASADQLMRSKVLRGYQRTG